MAGTFGKVTSVLRTTNVVAKLLKNATTTNFNVLLTSKPLNYRNQSLLLHTSAKQCGLMEFFDDEKNWGAQKVTTGRAWTQHELRLKSNEDLHKLWYVLLKERNMLKTMEHAYNEEVRVFPNPERIDKVEDSMENLETVVRERNQAYYFLETGEHGERPANYVNNALGLKFFYRYSEHTIPKFMNTKWKKSHVFQYGGNAVRKFLRLYREKLWNEKRRERNRQFNHVCRLLSKFPNVDMEAIKAKFPDVDIEKAKIMKKSRGHFVPK